jgi:radical SAM protein with 4Fe4S-binding SPASM domain
MDKPSKVAESQKALGYSLMSVEIEINSDCNRACAYCPNSKTERKNKGRMSEELFRRILTQLQEINYKGRISYHFYGEPLLNPDLDEFLKLTREYLPESRMLIYSNGTLMTEKRFHELVELGVDRFTITRHHGIKDYPFAKIYEGLSPEMKLKVKYQEHTELILSNRGGLLKVGYKEEKPPLNLPCLIPSTLMVITVNGNVVPCFEDYHEENVMGNVAESTIAQIWHTEKYRQFREDLRVKLRHKHKACDSCNNRLIIR